MQREAGSAGDEWSWEFFVARTDLSQEDVECHEGVQMMFRDPGDLAMVNLVPFVHDVTPMLREWIARTPPVLGERRFAGVLLVDPQGRLLLQERDEHARIDPDRWGLPGGHVEPGETFAEAAPRELLEETGVRLPDGVLHLWGELAVDHREAHGTWDRMQVFWAEVELADSDVECHEGRQIVFVDPAQVRTLPLTKAAEQILGIFHSRKRPVGS